MNGNWRLIFAFEGGEVLREYLGTITVTEAAARLGVNRVTLSRIASCAAGVYALKHALAGF